MTRELDNRARAYAQRQCDKYGDDEVIFNFYYNDYIEVAEEQRKVDVDNIIKWSCANCEGNECCQSEHPSQCATIKSIIKAMEE